MNLHQLRYFAVLAEICHVTQAAAHLHISQPTLSMSISSLEEELGIPLFERRRRSLRLTGYGRAFLEHVKVAIGEIDAGCAELREMVDRSEKNIRIGATSSLSASLLPDLLLEFGRLHSTAVIQLRQGPNMELLEGLARDESDFVFGRVEPSLPELRSLHSTLLYSEGLVILLSEQHPLAGEESLSLDRLRDESFIVFHESTGFGFIVEEVFSRAHFQPHVAYEVYDNSACLALVSKNLGVALASPTPHYENSRVRQVRLLDKTHTDIYLSWNAASVRRNFPLCVAFSAQVHGRYGIEIGYRPDHRHSP